MPSVDPFDCDEGDGQCGTGNGERGAGEDGVGGDGESGERGERVERVERVEGSQTRRLGDGSELMPSTQDRGDE